MHHRTQRVALSRQHDAFAIASLPGRAYTNGDEAPYGAGEVCGLVLTQNGGQRLDRQGCAQHQFPFHKIDMQGGAQ